MTKEVLSKAIELERGINNAQEKIKQLSTLRDLCYEIRHDRDAEKRLILNVPDNVRNISIQLTAEAAIKALEIDLKRIIDSKERMENKFKEL